MNQVKDTARATVRLGYDGRVHKAFRGPHAAERFANEVRVLQYLEKRACPFVPRLLDQDPEKLLMVTTNCGGRVERMDDARVAELFTELEAYGVRHEDRYLRNITYSRQMGRFCLIDFEFATILEEDAAASGDIRPTDGTDGTDGKDGKDCNVSKFPSDPSDLPPPPAAPSGPPISDHR